MKFTFILLLALVAGITTVTPAFADNSEITIGAVEKSGFSQDCVADGCYTPSSSTVNLGGKVIFTNTDTAGIHTFTAGTVDGFAPTPTGEFDSGVLAAGESDEWVADVEGEIPFYCALHTWMTGVIIVEAAEEMMEETVMEKEEMMKMETIMVGDVDVTMSPPIEGSEDATVSIIEFGDYQCPKCDQWFQNEKPTITENYIDTGKANLYFVDFAFLGEQSDAAANASYCANDQGMYWEYHSTLYNNQGGINEGWVNSDSLKQFAADLGLDTTAFNECVDSNNHADRISYNKQVGSAHGVEGTPVFIIIGADGSMERIDGPQSSAIFADVIDAMLGEPMKEAMAEEEMMKDTMMEEKEMMEMKSMSIGNIDVTMSPPSEGSDDATVTIIEFGDYQCPKCDQWFQNEKPTITSDYIDTGKANLYFVDFSFLGDDSNSAAEATYCAEEQGMYWEYHANLYNNQGDINGGWATTDNLKQFAADLGLDIMKFNSCLDSGKYSDRVSHNTSVGASNDVEGTPVFFIVASDGTTERIDGPQSSAIFAEVIDSMLGEPMKEAMAEEEMMKDDTMTEEKEGGGCLIATAAYGTELAPQVQFLREIRDNTVMSTSTGASFMTGFNQLYYSFSPTIADMERENPMFQEVERAFITPMISTLSIMTLAEDGNESQVLGLGISVIALNLGMYIAAPAIVGIAISKRLQSSN